MKCFTRFSVIVIVALMSDGFASASTIYLYSGGETTITLAPGTYDITTYGAAGGNSSISWGHSGGLGAEMEAEFTFTSATTLTLMVGGVGGNGPGSPNGPGGGGGGTFVVNGSTPLIVAGGGGGGGYDNTYLAGPGLVTNGGSPGLGGRGYAAAGGGGFTADGDPGNVGSWESGQGYSFLHGGGSAGGGFYGASGGGFGGGGGGGNYAGGGGGGYTGGSGGFGNAGGEGGGSYIDSSAISIGTELSGVASPDDSPSGEVIITSVMLNSSSWSAPHSGSWGNPSNWTDSIPDSPAYVANFNSASDTLNVVALDGSRTVGILNFNSLHSYVITPGSPSASSLILSNNLQTAQINVLAGSHAITAPVILNSNTTVTVSNPSDTLIFAAEITGSGSLNLAGQGTVQLLAPNNSTGSINVPSGVKLQIGPGGALDPDHLSLADGASLDITNHTISFDTSLQSPSSLIARLSSAYHNGAWDGSGITSSVAASDSSHNTSLGYLLVGNAFEIKLTYAGDANLDGIINADDYALIDRTFAQHLTSNSAMWSGGDFNYDGQVTSADYLLIDRVYLQQDAPLSPDFFAERAAQFGDVYVQQLLASVPEPSQDAIMATAMIFVLWRRNCRTRKLASASK